MILTLLKIALKSARAKIALMSLNHKEAIVIIQKTPMKMMLRWRDSSYRLLNTR